MRLLGVPLSQPFRAVVWPCLIKRTPFQLQLTVPNMKSKNGTRGAEFLEKYPLGTIPCIEDVDASNFRLSDSSAILMYLSDAREWGDFYPKDLQARARVHEYLFWSQQKVRPTSLKLFAPYVRFNERPSGDAWKAEGLKSLDTVCDALESIWLRNRPYIAGDHPTIADFSCYEEVAQFQFGEVYDFGKHPKVKKWMHSMASLPHHSEVHAANTALGRFDDLLALDEKGLGAKLASASKAGVTALTSAMKDYP